MKESMGGAVNIMFIATFMLVISGYLAFSVSYNKAFRVKNKIITILEQYGTYNTESKKAIDEFITTKAKMNTSSTNEQLSSGNDICLGTGYTIQWVDTTSKKTANELDDVHTGYYRVSTGVTLDVPIINRIMPYLKIFQISGDTITIYDNPSPSTETSKCPL